MWNYKTLINDVKEITMSNEINLTLKSFYENLFQKDIKKYVSEIETFLSQIQLPPISDENYAKCETDIIEGNLLVALKIMPSNKSLKMMGYLKNSMKLFGKM